ncbi:Protein C23H3.5 [Aphelenchoides avenae]|nr:Protein C23H3.5 [Aphelenchus avenae]
MRQNIRDFVDETLTHGTGKLFDTASDTSEDSVRRLQKLRLQLKTVLGSLKINQADGGVSTSAVHLYDSLTYKYGASNRHQKYWRITKQIYAELKRINAKKPLEVMARIVQSLDSGKCHYRPSSSAVCFVGASLLERICRLDRLRLLCAKMASYSMGYLDLGHLVTMNVLLIATAAEVADDCLTHIQHMAQAYNELATWFTQHSNRSSKQFGLRSLPLPGSKRNTTGQRATESIRSLTELLSLSPEEVAKKLGVDASVQDDAEAIDETNTDLEKLHAFGEAVLRQAHPDLGSHSPRKRSLQYATDDQQSELSSKKKRKKQRKYVAE